MKVKDRPITYWATHRFLLTTSHAGRKAPQAYHRATCQYVRDKDIYEYVCLTRAQLRKQITQGVARVPCKVCKPPKV